MIPRIEIMFTVEPSIDIDGALRSEFSKHYRVDESTAKEEIVK